jgi:SecD/SecF fusion protein
MTKSNTGTSDFTMAKWIFGAIVVVCIFQFLLYLPTNKVENRAESYANEMSSSITDELGRQTAYKEARTKYLDSISSTKIFSIPLLKDYTYNDLKKQQLGLGLDLKGGLSVILQVNLEDFLTSSIFPCR